MKRSIKDYLIILFKGVAMGAADVVPGVSGGTIAFISGIYEELINSIKSFNLGSLKLLFKEGLPTFWKAVNANFLIALFVGIGISVVSLAKILSHLLVSQPTLIWGFFFGLIVASAIFVAKTVEKWNIAAIISLVVGIAVAYTITVISPAETPNAYWFLFLSGALAICAMILPGISGAFILLLLSKYQYAVDALSNFKIDVILVLAAGAATGLLLFSNLLSWLLKKYRNLTIALLSGFMIGSLNKVWPWKETITSRINSHGVSVPVIQENILPNSYLEATQQEPNTIFVILLVIVGFLLIYFFERFATSQSKKNEIKQEA